MKKILVTGGRGFLGQQLLKALVQSQPDVHVLVPTRWKGNLEKAAYHFAHPRVQYLAMDVFDIPAMTSAMQGTQALVHLVAILHGKTQDFKRVHMDLPLGLAQAALAARVERVVHVSALGVSENAPSLYLRSKYQGELAWTRAWELACQPKHLTTPKPTLPGLYILRPSVIFGKTDRFTQGFAKMMRWLPFFPLPSAKALFQPVWVEDLAQALAALALGREPLLPDQHSHRYPILLQAAGPRVMSLQDLVTQVGEMAQTHCPVVPVPPAVAWLQAAVLGLWPGTHKIMSLDNLRSMEVPNVADPRLPGLDCLGIQVSGLEALEPHCQGSRV